MSTQSVTKKVVVCQNTTCKQQGSPKVLAAFERCLPDEVTLEASGCLGQCGNGPMVVVLAGEGGKKQWYAGVKPAEAFAIAAQHFKKGKPSLQKQSVQVNTSNTTVWIWLVGLVLFLSMCGLVALVLGGPSHYG
ncbi:MAG: (2Fe-2S) ferredoxin domain-containing protein [Cyanobacteria bacterium J06621_3]